jgi:hypothetical protein
VNFVIAHDGFTLSDLVSYNGKHNGANGEDGRDGTNDNHSWNCGTEGPTSDDAINTLRWRQMKNFHLALMVSQGTPMVLAGMPRHRACLQCRSASQQPTRSTPTTLSAWCSCLLRLRSDTLLHRNTLPFGCTCVATCTTLRAVIGHMHDTASWAHHPGRPWLQGMSLDTRGMATTTGTATTTT